jgi:hypothetical protein
MSCLKSLTDVRFLLLLRREDVISLKVIVSILL